ncbi:hypothetical protein PLICRDRAFT_101473 [Plicaturopsis crispa FD-325 SS-3]|nr:hypothetical protein PLICRDRAFT_101473 [Plicaturopsis crispa FD-325 SS-3]
MSTPATRLKTLLKSLPPRPVEQKKLRELVQKALTDKSKTSAENKKSKWEYLLKDEIFTLATTEGKALKDPNTTYYEELKVRLDLVLTFTELEACDQTFPFIVLQDLLETQTIASCSHIFSWLESRAQRLMVGMVPQKGKALILLRTLNDLLRRLSKMGSTTIFCGQILTFLSGVFPLGERSGVNLRGEYGPIWEGVKEKERKAEDGKGVESDKPVEESEKMEVDEGAKKDEATESEGGICHVVSISISRHLNIAVDFYSTFWSLQLPFSRPPLFAMPNTFNEFKDAVNKVLPVIKEATAKEKAMMGSRTLGGASGPTLKRKRETDSPEGSSTKDYFFAKFLTSPKLLDLEIADTHFRRQFLFQLLILLNHLQTFTKAAKNTWSTSRNSRSLHMDFTLEQADAQWVQEIINKVSEELRQTTPNGRAFWETVSTILEREQNWVKWKNELCAPFDREPWVAEIDGSKVGLEEATRDARKKMREDPEDWPWRLGSQPLTEIWEMGFRELSDLQRPFVPGDVKDFVKKIDQENARIKLRKQTLERQREQQLARARAKVAASKPASPAPAAPPADASSASSKESTLKASATGPEARPAAQEGSAPMSLPGARSPLHPSLPAKPGLGTSVSEADPGTTAPPPADPVIASAPNGPAPPPAALPQPVTPAAPTPAPAPAPAPVEAPRDAQIAKYEENKQRWSWLALRTARDQHLQHFGKIGTGDITLLAQEIETAKNKGEDSIAPSSVRILVTGAAGYIGSHVAYVLQQTRRYKVISIDNNHNSHVNALGRVSQIARNALPENASETDKDSAEIDSYTADLTKPEEVRKVFEHYGEGGIWGVIHIAAYKAVGESTEIPLTYYHNNVSATIILLQTMADFGVKRFVYSSSATVYGIPPVIPIPESTRLKADSPYGKTKVMSETIIDDLCHADTTWKAISLRYFNPAGAHPSGLIGEDPRGRPGNLLPLLAHMAVGRIQESTLKVFGNDYPTPDGTCVRDYLHVVDLASGHLLALEALEDGTTIFDNCPDEARYKAYNLGKGKGMSVLQIAEAMRKATGFDYKYEIIGRRRGDVPDLTADPTLAEKELGFKAPADLETMCRDLWNWQKNNPKGYDTE